MTSLPNNRNRFFLSISLLLIAASPAASQGPLPWERGTYDPAWAGVKPTRTIQLNYDSEQSPAENGLALARAIERLQPGDQLEVAAGKYLLRPKLTIDLQATERAPIWIVAADPESPPVITRPDASQNLINIGERRPCRYLVLRHLELTGGSVIIRFYDCAQVWLDRCELHHAAHGGITVNSRNTEHMFITRNHMHHFNGGTGEGMYLGANHSKVVMRNSVVAANHVHDCGGQQGDGIELKQGSYNNWIVENHIHDTHYPCLITYGTDGRGINLVERNICYRSGDNTMQIQGEAIVRNNLIMAAGAAGLASTDHQGKTLNLRVVHNTIITPGRGVNLSSWNGREGMVFANNAVYTQRGPAVRFPSGSARVTCAGNVVLGDVQGAAAGFQKGTGLDDFQAVSWDATQRDAEPVPGSPLVGTADPRLVTSLDLHSKKRTGPPVAGAVDTQ